MADPVEKPTATERREHFRSRARAGRRVELRYRRADRRATVAGPEEITAVTGDIGIGGAFVLTPSPEPVASALELAVIFPGSHAAIYLRADVRWVTDGEDDGHGAGMGLEFASLEVDALRALSSYFASLSTEKP